MIRTKRGDVDCVDGGAVVDAIIKKLSEITLDASWKSLKIEQVKLAPGRTISMGLYVNMVSLRIEQVKQDAPKNFVQRAIAKVKEELNPVIIIPPIPKDCWRVHCVKPQVSIGGQHEVPQWKRTLAMYLVGDDLGKICDAICESLSSTLVVFD